MSPHPVPYQTFFYREYENFDWRVWPTLTDVKCSLLAPHAVLDPSFEDMVLLNRYVLSTITLQNLVIVGDAADAEDAHFPEIAEGVVVGSVLLHRLGVPILHIGGTIGLPIRSLGGAVTIVWDNGPCRLFCIQQREP